MKISRNLFPFLSVVFLLSIFFMLISPSFSYATSSVRYWSSSDSVSYGGKTTYKMTIKDIEEKKGICIEAETSSPNYCASCSEHGEVGTLSRREGPGQSDGKGPAQRCCFPFGLARFLWYPRSGAFRVHAN